MPVCLDMALVVLVCAHASEAGAWPVLARESSPALSPEQSGAALLLEQSSPDLGPQQSRAAFSPEQSGAALLLEQSNPGFSPEQSRLTLSPGLPSPALSPGRLSPAPKADPADPFPTPVALRSAVQFWRDLFTLHASGRVIVHDREAMELVWRVIELPRDEAGVIDEARSTKVVKSAVEDLRLRLQRLESDALPIDEEDRVLLALAGDQRATRLAGAWERLRTQRGVADHFATGLARARMWQADMRQVAEKEGVPADILVLPFVESMFNPLARSHVGAAGLWQLMPATARSLGLKVSRAQDERLDVIKATRAAAKLLKQNYRMLGSWPLAITAYNHGPNGVRRAMNLVGSTDLVYLIDNYQRSTWGFASKNFYAEFLAALSIIRELPASEPQASVCVTDNPSIRF